MSDLKHPKRIYQSRLDYLTEALKIYWEWVRSAPTPLGDLAQILVARSNYTKSSTDWLEWPAEAVRLIRDIYKSDRTAKGILEVIQNRRSTAYEAIQRHAENELAAQEGEEGSERTP